MDARIQIGTQHIQTWEGQQMRTNGKEEMIGIEMSLFYKGTSFDKTEHDYIGGI